MARKVYKESQDTRVLPATPVSPELRVAEDCRGPEAPTADVEYQE